MAGDRAAVLSIRAATRGAIDFRQARPFEANWWRRLHLVTDELEMQELEKNLGDMLRYELAVLTGGQQSGAELQASAERAIEMMNELLNLRRPWASKDAAAGKQGQVTDLVTSYKQLVGDPNDPIVRARMLADLAKMQKVGEIAEDVNEMLDRRIKERDARRRAGK